MKTRVRHINFKGVVENRDAANSLLTNSGDVVIVERDRPRLIIMRCPCGCGDDLLINVDKRAGAAWRYYLKANKLTIYPSYWRDDKCGSHFIVWNNYISWCASWDDYESDTWEATTSEVQTVLAALPEDYFISYEDLAEKLGIIPWTALQACRQLVRQGLAISNENSLNSKYKKAKIQLRNNNKKSWFWSWFGKN